MSVLDELVVTSIEDVLSVYSERGRYVQMQNRRNFGLSFCKSGEIIYTHKGKRIVSEPACAVLLPMGESYELCGSRTGEFPLINFLCEGDIHDFYVFSVRHLEPYLRDFESMKDLSLLGRGRHKQMSLFYGILDRLHGEEADEKDLLAPILRYLEENYADIRLSNTLLSQEGNISEVYLRRLFKNRFGTTPKQYILELRMQKAKRLLEEGSATVNEIAAECGFSAVYHFCRTFKTFTGQAPTDYRRTHRHVLL